MNVRQATTSDLVRAYAFKRVTSAIRAPFKGGGGGGGGGGGPRAYASVRGNLDALPHVTSGNVVVTLTPARHLHCLPEDSMPLDTPTLKRKANDEATKTLDWFNDLADKLGERHAPKIRALGALLEDEHWCGVLRDVKENIRKDDMEMALTSEKVGTGKGALKQIEKYMDHTFLDLSKAPESAFAVKPESASKGCILEPTFKVKKELPVGSAADGEPDRVPMQSISRFVPNLLKRLRCKAPKSRALEHLDVAEASLFYWLYLVAQCSTPYGDGLRLEDAVTAFDNAMPKIPLRGTAAKNEMANPGSVPPRTWKPILEGIIHNVTKSAFLKAHKEKPLKLHPSDIVDEEAFNQLIEQGLPIVLDEREMPRFSIVVQSSNDNLNKNGGSAEEEETGAEPGGEDDDEGDDVPLAQRAAVLRSTSSGGTFTRGGGGVVADDELPPLPQTGEATGDAAGEGEGEAPPKPPAKKPAAKNRTKQTAPAKQTVPAQKTAPAKKTAPAMKVARITPPGYPARLPRPVTQSAHTYP